MQKELVCPNCKTNIDINSALYEQIYQKANLDFLKQKQEFEKEVQDKRKEYTKFLNDLNNQKLEQERIINQKVQDQLNEQLLKIQNENAKKEEQLKEQIKQNFQNEHEKQILFLKEELKQKSKDLGELLLLKEENEKLKREQKENEEKVKFIAKQEALKQIQDENDKKLEFEKEKLKLEFDKKNEEIESKNKQLQIQFESAKNEIISLKSKMEQGSQRLQGEAQELIIEEFLTKEFLYDDVKEVPKGVNGADCLHIVKDDFFNECGSILYEVKKTKEFSKDWIEKLKRDSIVAKADISVLISSAMPKDNQKTHFKEGVLICSIYDFKSIVCILRESLISIYKLKNTLANKEEKNHILYNYLNSKEFNTQITLILKSYKIMKDELEAEMRAMQNIWKKRARQIDNLTLNSMEIVASLNSIFSSLKGENLIGEDGIKSLQNLSDEENK